MCNECNNLAPFVLSIYWSTIITNVLVFHSFKLEWLLNRNKPKAISVNHLNWRARCFTFAANSMQCIDQKFRTCFNHYGGGRALSGAQTHSKVVNSLPDDFNSITISCFTWLCKLFRQSQCLSFMFEYLQIVKINMMEANLTWLYRLEGFSLSLVEFS